MLACGAPRRAHEHPSNANTSQQKLQEMHQCPNSGQQAAGTTVIHATPDDETQEKHKNIAAMRNKQKLVEHKAPLRSDGRDAILTAYHHLLQTEQSHLPDASTIGQRTPWRDPSPQS